MLSFESSAFFILFEMDDPEPHGCFIKVILGLEPIVKHPAPNLSGSLDRKPKPGNSLVKGAAQKLIQRIHRPQCGWKWYVIVEFAFRNPQCEREVPKQHWMRWSV